MKTIFIARGARRFHGFLLLMLSGTTAGCGSVDQLTSTSENPGAPSVTPVLSSGFRGGIPFGTWALPTTHFGELYNGAMKNIWANHLLVELAEIKSRGGKVVLSLAGKETNYLDRDHEFSLSLWKQRLEPYRDVDFSSYIEDGTIIGHYIIDEPNDPANWGGKPVPGSMVEQMAAYSKQLWPGMPTVVRAEPRYLAQTGGPYRYLDAAWAQYVTRKGTPGDYIARNVADARQLGLALITGLNIRKGNPQGREMSGSLMETAGSTLLASDYPCAFISWEYDQSLLARPEVQSAMRVLSRLAQNRPARGCRGASGGNPPPQPPDADDDDDGAGDDDEGPSASFTPPTCTVGESCEFRHRAGGEDGDDDGSDDIVSWNWDFGDGSSSDSENPSHTYAADNSYTVTLWVTADDGRTGSYSAQVTVNPATNRAPVAAFSVADCSAGVPCQFTDGSSDSDGSIVSRSWAFGEGGTSDQANPTISFARRGTYRVTLTVTDDVGARSSLTREVRVSRAALPSTNPIVLSLTTYSTDDRQYVSLSWSAMNGTSTAVYRNGLLRELTRNDGKYVRWYATRGPRTFTYRVCETGTSRCSNSVTTSIN